MANHRVRFCPKGHDKDAPGGSYLVTRYTQAGNPTPGRECAGCQALYRERKRARRKEEVRCNEHHQQNSGRV